MTTTATMTTTVDVVMFLGLIRVVVVVAIVVTAVLVVVVAVAVVIVVAPRSWSRLWSSPRSLYNRVSHQWVTTFVKGGAACCSPTAGFFPCGALITRVFGLRGR